MQIFLSIILLLFIANNAIAIESYDMEQALLNKINKARLVPLSAAVPLGIDVNALLINNPNYQSLLRNGTSKLEVNNSLQYSAIKHAEDMLRNNYYSKVSQDGRGYEDRILNQGYDAFLSREAIGVIAFVNFLSSSVAVERLFESMYRKELNFESNAQLSILDPDVNEIGIGIAKGSMIIKQRRMNVYIVVCDFGMRNQHLKLSNKASNVLINLINQARVKSFEVAHSLGYDLELLPLEIKQSLKGLLPLKVSENLMLSANNHTVDMLTKNYYSMLSLDGKTVWDRAYEAGYQADHMEEILAYYPFNSEENMFRGTEYMFINLFIDTLNNVFNNSEIGKILNNNLNNIGVSVGSGLVYLNNSIEHLHLTTCDFGDYKTDDSYLVGIVYEDLNNNNLYNADEGILDAQVLVEPIKTPFNQGLRSYSVLTNDAGGFIVKLIPSIYRISIVSGDRNKQYFMVISKGSNWLDYKFN